MFWMARIAASWLSQTATAPHTAQHRRNSRSGGSLPRFRSETGTQGAHGRDSGFLLPVRLVLEYAGCSRCKVGAGFCPQKAFGGRLRQAKCSACPTRGWVKSAPPAVQLLAAQALSALRGDVEFAGYPALAFVP